MPYTIEEFDSLPEQQVRALLLECCSSATWTAALVGTRLFGSRDALLRGADEALAALDSDDLEEALAGHPRISENSQHPASRREQAAVSGADERERAELVPGNRAYEERFGRVYLVRAAGHTAGELLDILR